VVRSKGFELRLSRVCDDIFVASEDGSSKRVVLHRLLSLVCGDIFLAFEDVWSKRLVLHCLLSTV